MVRTRIPPSPTGNDLHIGNLYTALINWAYAKKNNGKFIVRIEDSDRARLVEGAAQQILKTLHAFGLDPDEDMIKGGPYGPYIQSERLELYKKYALQLVSQGDAYYCFCTQERLEEVRQIAITEKKQPKYDRHCLHLSAEDKEKKIKNIDLRDFRISELTKISKKVQEQIKKAESLGFIPSDDVEKLENVLYNPKNNKVYLIDFAFWTRK